MTYTYPLALPTHTGMSAIRQIPDSAIAITQSPWDYTQESQKNQGQLWHFEAVLPIMSRADAVLWEAFFLKLNGREQLFLLGHPGEATPLGAATGTPLVDGAGQTGGTINLKGFTFSITNILKAGDWLQLGAGATARLYKVLDNVNSDGAGKCAVNVWPNIISTNSPADGATVVFTNAQGVFRMDDNVAFDTTTAMLYNFSFKATSQV